jgi:hypothetical protein
MFVLVSSEDKKDMKKFVLFVLCITVIANLYSQGNSSFYYYKGNKIMLNESEDSCLVYFDNGLITQNMITQKYNVIRPIILDSSKADTLSAYIVTYDGDISAIKNNPEVWNIEPIVNGMPVSNVFYIQLKSYDDTCLLFNLSTIHGTSVVGALSECDRWYKIAVNNATAVNALEACNIFWESGLFADVSPGFIPELCFDNVTQNNRT